MPVYNSVVLPLALRMHGRKKKGRNGPRARGESTVAIAAEGRLKRKLSFFPGRAYGDSSLFSQGLSPFHAEPIASPEWPRPLQHLGSVSRATPLGSEERRNAGASSARRNPGTEDRGREGERSSRRPPLPQSNQNSGDD
jgi:hypothetical protein